VMRPSPARHRIVVAFARSPAARQVGHAWVTRLVHAHGVGAVGTEQSGILILRAWVEGRTGDRLRVRVTQVLDSRELPVTAAATIDDVCDLVRTWLEALVEGSCTGQVTRGYSPE
jgi:hypothetical protein